MSDVSPCADEPCQDCPWRTSNVGRRSPMKVVNETYGWFSAKNRRRLWAKLRRGEAMTCHPTDPRHPGVAEGVKTKECAGALILQQREFMVYQALFAELGADEALAEYRRRRPGGLTRKGIVAIAWNGLYGHVPFFGGRQQGRPDLNADVSLGDGKLPWPTKEVPCPST